MASDQHEELLFSDDRRFATHGKIIMIILVLLFALFLFFLIFRLYLRHSRKSPQEDSVHTPRLGHPNLGLKQQGDLPSSLFPLPP
ncbi:hypothetical protein MRB53_003958 [Persea americana]|uniref:Uncharacterized protein n=1 Tax=Persea americana TaxID=3435 RepID=A0ACC2MYV7_PERAE|nr:hypothetical protein MRB53_003958 [Persea americana]